MTQQKQLYLMITALQAHCMYLEIGVCKFIDRDNEKTIYYEWKDSLIPFLKFQNTHNFANIWIRPKPDIKHPWLFIDDVNKKNAEKIASKYQSIVVQTSPDIYQIRLLSNINLDREERTNVQRNLVDVLGHYNADPGSIAGCKFGRLPGFRNRKIGKNCWTNLISIPNTNLPKFDPSKYLVNSKFKSSPNKPAKSIGIKSSNEDQSRKDFGYILGRLKFVKEKGYDINNEKDKLYNELVSNSSRKVNPKAYAKRTIDAVLKII